MIVAVFFLLGLFFRLTVFIEPHAEGDELIYSALVEQLEDGNGYTLQGTPLVTYGAVDREQYDRKLFFHPPGGIALFWLSNHFIGPKGIGVVQVLSYALFFWSMVLLARLLGLTGRSIAVVGALSAFNPIMAHVATNYWLDGPLLAFSTFSAALFIRSVVRKSLVSATVAGVVLGYASLIKITAVLVIPGVLVMAWFLLEPPRQGAFIRFAACLVVPAFIVQLPWEVWQWIEFGTPFPGWAGKPSKTLIESNRYVHFLTVVRSPWIYLTLLPRISWTIAPAIVLYFVAWNNKTVRRLGFALLVWIITVLAFHVLLGFKGYSKVIRYVILVAPPAVILFSAAFFEAIERLKTVKPSFSRGLYAFIIVVAALAILFEIAAGVKSSLLYDKDLIFPLIGGL